MFPRVGGHCLIQSFSLWFVGGRNGQFPNRPSVLHFRSRRFDLDIRFCFSIAALKARRWLPRLRSFSCSRYGQAPPPIHSPRRLMRTSSFCDSIDRGDPSRYPPREEVPLPTQPPYTAFVGNLPFDLTEFELEQHFGPHKVCTCFANWPLKYGRRPLIHRLPLEGGGHTHIGAWKARRMRTVLFWYICTFIPRLTVGMHSAVRRREHCPSHNHKGVAVSAF
jgi:hypothetical protein